MLEIKNNKIYFDGIEVSSLKLENGDIVQMSDIWTIKTPSMKNVLMGNSNIKCAGDFNIGDR
jgi:hypothetical protein